jgi:hypothetical protein
MLGGHHRITYDMDRDMLWRWDQVLKTHPNGMRFSCFDQNGDMLATNEYFSVGGGFVVNEKTKGMFLVIECVSEGLMRAFVVDENLFYKGVDKTKVHGARLHQTHSLTDPADHPVIPAVASAQAQQASDAGSTTKSSEPEYNDPPYAFDTGNSLLALTKKHNVRHAVCRSMRPC